MAALIHGPDKGSSLPIEPHPTDGETLVVLGSPGSPYTLKVRAALAYMRRRYRNVTRGGRDDRGFKRPPGPPLLPNVILPGGEPLGDSTYILRKLDVPDRSIYPPGAGAAFLCDLLEDFADEWCTKCMFHYRWVYDEDKAKAAAILPNFATRVTSDEMQANLAKAVGDRQIGRLGVVGSNPQSGHVIESSYIAILEVLKDHFHGGNGFLFGRRPSAADFALFGQLSQLVLFDPTPSRLAAEVAPNVVAWVWNMVDLSGHSALPSDWEDTTPTLRPLFTVLGITYAPLLLANDRAVKMGQKTVTVHTPWGSWTQPSFKYQSKCLAQLQQTYNSLPGPDKAFVDSALVGTGADKLFLPRTKL